jgi:hypothetical protein
MAARQRREESHQSLNRLRLTKESTVGVECHRWSFQTALLALLQFARRHRQLRIQKSLFVLETIVNHHFEGFVSNHT